MRQLLLVQKHAAAQGAALDLLWPLVRNIPHQLAEFPQGSSWRREHMSQLEKKGIKPNRARKATRLLEEVTPRTELSTAHGGLNSWLRRLTTRSFSNCGC